MIRQIGFAALVLTCGLMFTPNALSQEARPGDRAVEDLIEQVDEAFQRFERKLDGDVRRGVLRGPRGEVDVQAYLKDLDEDLDRLGDRFRPGYSASAELQVVLEKAAGIDAFMKSQSAALDGRSEWDVTASALNALAGAYAASFPLREGATARRINDAEVSGAAQALSRAAGTYRRGLKAGYTREEGEALSAAQSAAGELGKAADQLRSRVRSGKPSSGEAGVVLERLAQLESTVAGRQLPPAASQAWNAMGAAVATIRQAYGLGVATPR